MNDFDYTPENQTVYSNSPYTPLEPQKNNSKGFSVAALVLSILSLILACACCTYIVSPLLAILSIVFALISKKKNAGAIPAMAITALILSILALLIFFFILCIDVYFASMSTEELDALIKELTGKSMEDFFAEAEAAMPHRQNSK